MYDSTISICTITSTHCGGVQFNTKYTNYGSP